jgi:RNA polymerase sigma-70 factor, ECF subfamily
VATGGSSADAELMRRLRTGERAAFEAILEQHQRFVYGFLRARVWQPNDAEDLLQEVFLRFFQTQARFDTESLIRPWLLGIARNVLREFVRDRHRGQLVWTELCLELETVAGRDHDDGDDVLRWLPECLQHLGPSARQAIDLHYHADQKLTVIAATLHRSEGAVKLLLHRARQALRDCLQIRQRDATR